MVHRFCPSPQNSPAPNANPSPPCQPVGIDLTSFTYRKGEHVKIVGEAMDVDRVYDFKNKLDDSELFTKTSLQGPRFDKRKRKQVFDIEMTLAGNGES